MRLLFRRDSARASTQTQRKSVVTEMRVPPPTCARPAIRFSRKSLEPLTFLDEERLVS